MDRLVSSSETSPLPAPCLQTHPPLYHSRQLRCWNLRRQTREPLEPAAPGTTSPRKRRAGHVLQPIGPRLSSQPRSREPIKMWDWEAFLPRLHWKAECVGIGSTTGCGGWGRKYRILSKKSRLFRASLGSKGVPSLISPRFVIRLQSCSTGRTRVTVLRVSKMNEANRHWIRRHTSLDTPGQFCLF